MYEVAPMPSEVHVTVEASEVSIMPVLIHGLGVLSREYELITCPTTWSKQLCKVPLTPHGTIFGTVAQVNQHLFTTRAHEASCMP